MKRTAARRLALAGAVALASAAWAAEDDRILYPGKATPTTAPATGGVGTFTLVVGAALAAAGGWLLWRGRRQAPGVAVGRALAIAETRSLGNRQYLVVATYEDKKFLLGVCPDRIEMLAPLHEEKRGP
ncbi:MAG: flagellar biosynthetic protein FliO [Verrucomicrobia bacterium]|jgi:flagellar protein FliO/FliZ|nr:flagellar biosynthetic protein FliO [Verrucomicrobiota bacterium]